MNSMRKKNVLPTSFRKKTKNMKYTQPRKQCCLGHIKKYLKDKHGVSAKDLKDVKKDNVLTKWVEHGAPELDMNFDEPIPDDIFGDFDAF